MFNNLSIKSRLAFVISMLSLLLIGVGSLGLYGINKSNESLRGVYQDRAVPLGDLALIVDRMQRIRLNTAMASYGRDIEFAKQRKELTNQRDAEITATWQKYLATNLTPEEKTPNSDSICRYREKSSSVGKKPMPRITAIRRFSLMASAGSCGSANADMPPINEVMARKSR